MQTTSSSYWSGLREALTQLSLDYARARFVDVETRDDDRYIPDNADMRYTGLGDERGISASSLALVGLGLLGAAALTFVLLRR